MLSGVPAQRPEPASPLWRLIASCLGIASLWILEQGPVLAFADAATLRFMRRSAHLHSDDLEVLVVLDGERFESAWGPRRLGSLAQWEWQYTSPTQACYQESRWDPRGDGTVVRVARQASLLWRRSSLDRT